MPQERTDPGPDGAGSAEGAGGASRTLYPGDLRDAEDRLLRARRAAAGVDPGAPVVGFALSGGGIRSATFCLGVFQSLARRDLLSRIDYVSTVSGGGYFGGFLGRLFTRHAEAKAPVDAVRGVLVDSDAHEIRWLRDSGRYLAPTASADGSLIAAMFVRNLVAVQIVFAALILLFFLLADALRLGLLALAGTGAERLAAWALSAPPPGARVWWSPWLGLFGLAGAGLCFALGWAYWLAQPSRDRQRWSRWALHSTLAVCLVSAVWLTARHPRPWLVACSAALALLFALVAGTAESIGREADRWRTVTRTRWRFYRTAAAAALVVAAPTTAAIVVRLADTTARLLAVMAGAAAMAILAFAATASWSFAAWMTSGTTIEPILADTRNRLTGALRGALLATLGGVLFGLVDSLGQTLYAVVHDVGPLAFLRQPKVFAPLSAVLAIYGLVQRFLPRLLAGSGADRAARRIPWQVAASAGAAVVALVVLVGLCALGHAVSWSFAPPAAATWQAGAPERATFRVADTERGWVLQRRDVTPEDLAPARRPSTDPPAPAAALPGPAHHAVLALVSVFAALTASWLFGRTLQFINYSSHHSMYASRLSRAYLGASNPLRKSSPDKCRIGEVVPGDDVDFNEYAPHAAGGPLHLVNVTFNETRGGATNVESRDRKGLPLAVGPAGISVGSRHHATWSGPNLAPVPRDGFRIFTPPAEGQPITPERMTLGGWVAISGAAFSTGLGWRTSLGASLLTGLANVRLGYWWNSGVDPLWRRKGDVSRGTFDGLAQLVARAFPVQALYLAELLARFPGPARQYWYLTDGGHFENTGCYELLRRRVPLIVCLDNGADPRTTCQDIAALVRKARTDFGAEIHFGGTAPGDPEDRVPGIVGEAEMLAGRSNDLARLWRGHAMIGAVHFLAPGQPREDLEARTPESVILFVKPTLTGDEPLDVLEYARSHPDFPNESTGDQFFDEAQWESYRRLGEHIGEVLFGGADGFPGASLLRRAAFATPPSAARHAEERVDTIAARTAAPPAPAPDRVPD